MMNMIKNKLVGAVCVLGAVSMLAVAGANASTVSVDPNSVSVIEGGSFSATVVGDFGDVGGTAQGGFSLFWDPSILTLNVPSSGVSSDIVNVIVGQVIANAGDSGFAFLDTSNALAGSLDMSFSLCPLASPCDALSNFNIMDLVFDATNPGTSPVDAGLSLIGDVWWDSTATAPLATQPDLLGATVTVSSVPIPAAVWLFGSGLLGLVGVARRRS